MQEPPRRGGRSRRRGPPRPRPTQAPAQPQSPRDRAPQPPRRAERGDPDRKRSGPPARRGRGRPRVPAGERGGTPIVIVLDRREGEPDLTGARGIFEGYFDPETGDRRQPGEGIARLRVGNDRLWGTEVWWRADPAGEGLTTADHEELEVSKKLLRGLLREARRQSAFARKPQAT